jgi:hypothetical protein
MRKRFDKSPAIDAASSLRLVSVIRNHDEPYTEEENGIVDRGLKKFLEFQQVKSNSFKLRSPLTQAKLGLLKGSAWAWASTQVRASPEEVLGFVWDADGREKRKPNDVEKSVDERSAHNQLVYNMKRTPAIISDRDFLGRVVWRAEGTRQRMHHRGERNSSDPIPSLLL